MATHSRFCWLENPNRQRSLAGYSAWGCKESDMTATKHRTVEFSIDSPIPFFVNTCGVEYKGYSWLPLSCCLALRAGRRVTGSPWMSTPVFSPTNITRELSLGTHWKEAYGTTVSAPEHRELPLNRKQISTVFVYNKEGGWGKEWSFHWVKNKTSELTRKLLFFSYRISLIIWRKFYLLETNYSNDSIIFLSFSKWKKDKSTMERKSASHLRRLGKILEPWICQQIFMIWSYTSAKLQWTGCFKDHCYPCSCTDDEEQHSRYYTFDVQLLLIFWNLGKFSFQKSDAILQGHKGFIFSTIYINLRIWCKSKLENASLEVVWLCSQGNNRLKSARFWLVLCLPQRWMLDQ